MNNAVHLHTHTEYSVLDGIIKIPELIKQVKSFGMPAVAITDHGTIGGIPEFWKECKKADIKPILGCEFYHSIDKESKENYHITLLAKNKIGFQNLVNLTNRANDNFYKRPRVTTADIKEFGTGIIGLSGCMGSYMSQTTIAGKTDWNFYQEMKECLEDFFLEIHYNEIPEQKIIMDEFLKSGLPCVCAVDAHYLKEDHKFAHSVALGIMTNKKIDDPKAFKFNGDGYYIKDRSEMELLFPKETIDMTMKIADMIENYDIGFENWDMPEIEVDVDQEFRLLDIKLDEYLCSITDWEEPNKTDIKIYNERLKYEFGVIKDNGFLPYFKMVAGLCKYFDDNNMFRGWARGSAGGSLVAFLYGITKIDPIEWGLYFERFLNPSRITPPDIDLDFQPDHKSIAIDYFREHYGEVYQIGSYGTLSSKEVINSVSRIMGYSTKLGEYVPEQAPVPSIADLMEKNKPFQREAMKCNKQFVETLLILEKSKKNVATHASGVIVGSKTPYRTARSGVNKGLKMTMWDMYALEDMKYVKFDILGVTNLAIIDKICKAVNLKVEDISLNDAQTFDIINKLDTVGIFQWESDGFKNVIKRLHPDTFDELLDLNTLYRPGPIESGLTDQYINRKFGKEKVVQLHPKLKMKTQGLPLYQEDIMSMARDLAGFTLSEADLLRKAIGKKNAKLFTEVHEMWIIGCNKNGIDEQEAINLWDMIEKFARYTWNKAHSVAYTLISWWTAYLSAHYPAHFMCELMNSANSADRKRVIISECRRRKIDLKHPDINISGLNAVVYDGSIFFGLSGVKYVGEKSLLKMLAVRDEGAFLTIQDLMDRTKLTSRMIEYLAMAGAFVHSFDDEIPTLEDEKEALGSTISGRIIDKYWWKDKCSILGEIIDVHRITTKKGDPMCFLKIEYQDRIDSATVFPGLYSVASGTLKKGYIGLFDVEDRGVLNKFSDPDRIDHFKIAVNDGDGFLSFRPSLIGEPNIYCGGASISRMDLDDKALHFIEDNFGVNDIFI